MEKRKFLTQSYIQENFMNEKIVHVQRIQMQMKFRLKDIQQIPMEGK